MRKLWLLILLAVITTISATARTANQPANSADWKPALIADVVKKFSLTEADARQAIVISQAASTSVNYYLTHPVQTPKGLQRNDGAIDEVRVKEKSDFIALLKDEVKANQVMVYLQKNIPTNVGAAVRKR
jgi:hypothetical protein